MNYLLKKLSVDDGNDIYNMLQNIPNAENGYVNKLNVATFNEYKSWERLDTF